MAEHSDGSTWRHPGLGRRFHLLFGASVISNIGDGLAFTAFPLLAARVTTDALSISLVTAAGTLPFVLVGLVTGVVVDRLDRRQVMVVANVAQTVVVAGLVAAIVGSHIGVVALCAFAAAIGIGASVFTVASQAIMPALVSGDRPVLARANARFFGSEVFGVQVAGPAAGGVIFAASRSLPFTVDAVTFALSALLIGGITGRYRAAAGDRREPLLSAARVGVRWLAHHRLLRTYTLAAACLNLAVAGEEAVLVVLAERRLGLGAGGFGLLFACAAVGGLPATLAGGALARRFHEATLLRGGFALIPLGALLTGTAPDPVVCGVGLALTGYGLMTVNVAVGPLRQVIVPPELLGRVFAASLILVRGALPVGAVLGGLLAEWQPRAPFLAAAGFMALVTAASAAALSPRVIDGERAAARDRGTTAAPAG